MKILEIADLHLDPKWLELQKSVLQIIYDTAIKEKVDCICIAGDIYNRPFYNSDKDCIPFVIKYFEDLLKIAPVICITGTLSHDAPGSYAILEKLGCHVLQPHKLEIIGNMLFIGLPEIDKSNLMARKKMNMQEANEYINDSINKYITEYWAPIREENKNIPCVFLGHGWFVDDIDKARTNSIIKDQDVIIDNKKLSEINADRYIFGHVHQLSESKVLNGGYVGFAGFDNTPWNNTGFQPGFNVTEIKYNQGKDYNFISDISQISINRFDYPVIRKEKINIDLSTLKKMSKEICGPDTNRNYDLRIKLKIKKSDLIKIDLKSYEEQYRIKYNLNSCEIIPDIIREESNRITKEQAEKLMTLWDKYCAFKGWTNQDINECGKTDGFLNKINEIEKNVSLKSVSIEKKIVKLLYLEIKGSIFSLDAYNKNTLQYDFSKDPDGLTLIVGENGQCKSTFFGFASPYPVFIGWDYRSLKEFFPEGGHIIKRFELNGKIHEHIIQIPGKNNKKILCYWNIENNFSDKKQKTIGSINEPFIKDSQLKSFFAECEKYFGPLSSFISTSFFAQESWRMKNQVSSIASASQTELRNAYMAIVGISRENEKAYAKQKKDELISKIHDLETEKNTMSRILEDKETVVQEKEKIKKEINELERQIGILVKDKYEKEKQFTNTEKKYNEQKEIENKILSLKEKLTELYINKTNNDQKIKDLAKINITELKKQLENKRLIVKQIEELRKKYVEITKKNIEIKEDIEVNKTAIKNCDNKMYELNNLISVNKVNKKKYESENIILSKPCHYCGKIPHPDNEKIILQNIKYIDELFNKNKENKTVLSNYKQLKQEHEKHIENQKQQLQDKELENITADANKLKLSLLSEEKIQVINNSITEYSQIEIYKKQYEETFKKIKTIESEIADLENKKNPFIEKSYDTTKQELTELETQFNGKNVELSRQTGLLTSINTQLEKIKKYENQINDILKKLDDHVINMSEWETIEKDMMPNKLPAFELSVVATEIDFEVNQKLKGRYIIETETQYVNNKGEIIDHFDITVYNPISGIKKSLLAHSPGQRAAYFIEPISQALREKRQEKEKIIFQWSIADETDNPIKYIIVKDYYDIVQDSLQPGHVRFVMSQKSEIESFIKNKIKIADCAINIEE